MRVVVVGASGNIGTAILQALTDAPEIDSVVGVARRLPVRAAAPYDAAEWVSLDVGAETRDDAAEEALVDGLVRAFEGADCVIHLAWLLQPNHDRELLRRTNVDGTARVAAACVRAGVGHLVCASSWAAYSPVADTADLAPRDESWPTGGVPSSHYSVDKAAQERVLDELEAEHPDLVVARMRTALVFTASAGASIGRYFLGPWVPRGILRPGLLPLLPVPDGVRAQVVHAQDAAAAYLAVVRHRAGGGFNVTTDEVLLGRDLARILDHGRTLTVPTRAVRPLLHYAWRARVSAADAGWLDMATALPVMDAGRIRRELGWEPRFDAATAVRELLGGMVERQGGASVPLRPHDTGHEGAPGRRPGLQGSASLGQGDGPVDRELLGIYLDDHLTGATGGVERIGRMARSYADTSIGPELTLLAAEIAAARDRLRTVIEELGLPTKPHRQALAWAAERAGRLKLNGRLLGASPLTVVLELELMRSAVAGQLALWQTMTELAGELGLPREDLAGMAERSRGFQSRLEDLHARVRGGALRT
ncbi:NAD-dependent epimerase/dehydratase family protein [Georgenia alba]|uniref:NAD-dependent epimerase/dehydratase family protein n=1 Tax=Georgenia alba TaxID=2233858 RepID=A0ABW2Q541_9MICO